MFLSVSWQKICSHPPVGNHGTCKRNCRTKGQLFGRTSFRKESKKGKYWRNYKWSCLSGINLTGHSSIFDQNRDGLIWKDVRVELWIVRARTASQKAKMHCHWNLFWIRVFTQHTNCIKGFVRKSSPASCVNGAQLTPKKQRSSVLQDWITPNTSPKKRNPSFLMLSLSCRNWPHTKREIQ